MKPGTRLICTARSWTGGLPADELPRYQRIYVCVAWARTPHLGEIISVAEELPTSAAQKVRMHWFPVKGFRIIEPKPVDIEIFYEIAARVARGEAA